ncbi:MAG: ankyrin repeat domain-containing protein [Candidatus Aquirickettsiella sp.]
MDIFLMDEETSKKYALFFAADLGFINIINFLLKEGVDIDAQDEGGDTALHFAARRGHTLLITYLLERRAKISLNKKNRTPLLDAYANSQSESARIITKFCLKRNSLRNFEHYEFKKVESKEQIGIKKFINDCKKHIKKTYLNRNLFNRILARHNQRALALIIALDRCNSIKEAKELINNQCNLLKKGISSTSISEYLLDKRWSKEIKNRPKNVDKSSFYKMLKTLPEAPKTNLSQQKEKTLHAIVNLQKK